MWWLSGAVHVSDSILKTLILKIISGLSVFIYHDIKWTSGKHPVNFFNVGRPDNVLQILSFLSPSMAFL